MTCLPTVFLTPPLLLSGLHSDLSLTSLDGEEGETLRRGALAAACADAVAAYATLEGSRVRDSIAAHARRALERERQIDEKNEIIADLSSKVSLIGGYSDEEGLQKLEQNLAKKVTLSRNLGVLNSYLFLFRFRTGLWFKVVGNYREIRNVKVEIARALFLVLQKTNSLIQLTYGQS